MLGPLKVRADGTYVFASPIGTARFPFIALTDLGFFARYIFDHRAETSARELDVASDFMDWPTLVATFTKVTGKKAEYVPLTVDEWMGLFDDADTARPVAGERPLWDFPEGLYRREVAAYELSVALGWDCIPATVERDDVLGVGSLQRFVEADFSRHYFVLRDEERHDDQLLRMGVFDLLANNTDRKGGHVLVDADDHIWGIDNGLCFSTEARLRTVIWDFAGEPIPDDLMDAVATLR